VDNFEYRETQVIPDHLLRKVDAAQKALLHKAAERTIPNFCGKIGELIATLSATECARYFTHARYASK
jgi:hypothetical protein